MPPFAPRSPPRRWFRACVPGHSGAAQQRANHSGRAHDTVNRRPVSNRGEEMVAGVGGMASPPGPLSTMWRGGVWVRVGSRHPSPPPEQAPGEGRLARTRALRPLVPCCPQRCCVEKQEGRLKITKVEPLLLDRYLLVQVHTDAGITGLGESGAWGYLEASEAAVQKYGRYLDREGPAADRASLAVHVPVQPLPRLGDHGGVERD